MALKKICPVCNKEIASWDDSFLWKMDKPLHSDCVKEFDLQPTKYGAKPEAINAKNEHKEQLQKEKEVFDNLQKEIKDKSVYVRGFDMPFGEMITFMVKWALASIPAFIILFIIFGILFLIFGSLFF